MALITRRHFLQGAGTCILATAGVGTYSTVVEAGLRLDITQYGLTLPHWPAGLTLRAAILSDIHACEPWMSPARVRLIAEATNALAPDIIFILGDFNGGNHVASLPVWPEQWAEALSILHAPLGTYAVLGNHDLLHGPLPSMRGDRGASIRRALVHTPIKLLENEALRLEKDNQAFWIAGLGDQTGYFDDHHRWKRGPEDLPGTLAQIRDDAPVLLLAHEPHIFARIVNSRAQLPEHRIALTLAGHTHGGQINLPGVAAYKKLGLPPDMMYGHVVRDGHHMIVSGGLGTSFVPVRFNRPPEIVEVTIGDGLMPKSRILASRASFDPSRPNRTFGL